jgi:hypothetical protein
MSRQNHAVSTTTSSSRHCSDTITTTRRPDGTRPAYGATARLQRDPHWRDLILFHEYFDGDTGAGLGVSHQTGWTALVAKLLQQTGMDQ